MVEIIECVSRTLTKRGIHRADKCGAAATESGSPRFGIQRALSAVVRVLCAALFARCHLDKHDEGTPQSHKCLC